ncbi:hypothetical protein CALVIDRAFT_541851 [Calocera viscosa TUFC12733]|uniref:Uncharacterized protein n=1 Tax=Calocera viscosa (strain TUFC12733) TaxID=1330018 RepID=A0A167HBC8_CALVF|nr:hypothetical protein CALVIDRAFT_541851 [Calocera viscosa TUFC12733]
MIRAHLVDLVTSPHLLHGRNQPILNVQLVIRVRSRAALAGVVPLLVLAERATEAGQAFGRRVARRLLPNEQGGSSEVDSSRSCGKLPVSLGSHEGAATGAPAGDNANCTAVQPFYPSGIRTCGWRGQPDHGGGKGGRVMHMKTQRQILLRVSARSCLLNMRGIGNR